jgi:serralysin
MRIVQCQAVKHAKSVVVTTALAVCSRWLVVVAALASIVFASTSVLISPPPALAATTVTKLSPITYTAFDGHTETLIPWQGNKVTVLVQRGVTRDATVMTKMVSAFDRAWNYYAKTVGRLPATAHSLNGRVEVAEVNTTCGAGCGFLGATGVELQSSYFESTVYAQLANHGLYDQAPFYEFGRNFWFWSPQLEWISPTPDSVTTGFAVWMRFRSMNAAKVRGGPYNGTAFTTFRSQVAHLAGQYEADTSLTWASTFGAGKSPGLYGPTDFWASLMMQLASRHGGQMFVSRFFHHAFTLPTAATNGEVVKNWVAASNYAACVDLSTVFYDRWGFPRPDGSVTARPPAASVPEPVGHC